MTKLNFVSAIAAIISGITVIILIFYVINPDRIPSSPVLMSTEITSPTELLCPGDEVVWNTTMTIQKPTTIQGFITIVDLSDRRTVFSQQLGLPAMNHPVPVIVTRKAVWEIPPLSPGEYERILSILSLSHHSAPAFTIIPFSIRENCES